MIKNNLVQFLLPLINLLKHAKCGKFLLAFGQRIIANRSTRAHVRSIYMCFISNSELFICCLLL